MIDTITLILLNILKLLGCSLIGAIVLIFVVVLYMDLSLAISDFLKKLKTIEIEKLRNVLIDISEKIRTTVEIVFFGFLIILLCTFVGLQIVKIFHIWF